MSEAKISPSIPRATATDTGISSILRSSLHSEDYTTTWRIPDYIPAGISSSIEGRQQGGALRAVRPVYIDVSRDLPPSRGGIWRGRGLLRRGRRQIGRFQHIVLRWTNIIGLTTICLIGIIISGLIKLA